jgi:hypothetical protein
VAIRNRTGPRALMLPLPKSSLRRRSVSAERALQIRKLVNQLLGSQLYLSENLSDQRTGQVSSRMVGYRRSSAVWVPVEDVAALLSHDFEAEAHKKPHSLF